MFYLGVCIVGGHILLFKMSYWDTCFMEEGMYYWKTCVSAGYVFHESMCCGRTCEVGGHVLQVCAEATI